MNLIYFQSDPILSDAFCQTLPNTIEESIKKDRVDILRILLKNKDPNTFLCKDELLIQIAIRESSLKSLEFLLENGANPNTLNPNQKSVLNTLFELDLTGTLPGSQKEKILKLLCEHGLDPFLNCESEHCIYLKGKEPSKNAKLFIGSLFMCYWKYQLKDLSQLNFGQILQQSFQFLEEKGFDSKIQNAQRALEGQPINFNPLKEFEAVFCFMLDRDELYNPQKDVQELITFIENFPNRSKLFPFDLDSLTLSHQKHSNIYVAFLQVILFSIFVYSKIRPFQTEDENLILSILDKEDPLIYQVFINLRPIENFLEYTISTLNDLVWDALLNEHFLDQYDDEHFSILSLIIKHFQNLKINFENIHHAMKIYQKMDPQFEDPQEKSLRSQFLDFYSTLDQKSQMALKKINRFEEILHFNQEFLESTLLECSLLFIHKQSLADGLDRCYFSSKNIREQISWIFCHRNIHKFYEDLGISRREEILTL